MNSDDLAWLAGYLEGEGSFICSTPARRRVCIAVTSTDRDVIECLTRIVPHSRQRGPFPPSGLGKKPQYDWRLTIRPLVVDLTTQLRPLMCKRRQEQIDALLAYTIAYPALRTRGAPQPHGTRIRFDRGCTCKPCRDAENAYQRERRKIRKARAGTGVK